MSLDKFIGDESFLEPGSQLKFSIAFTINSDYLYSEFFVCFESSKDYIHDFYLSLN